MQHLGFTLGLMGSHGPTCGCPFCITWGRVKFFCGHPDRHPRFLEAAGYKIRILYTQLVDIAEGFAPAFEIPGHPLLRDPCLLPQASAPPPVGATGKSAPGKNEVEEDPLLTTAKSRAAPPLKTAAGATSPEERETKGEKEAPKEEERTRKEKAPSTSAPRGSKDKDTSRGSGRGKRERSRERRRERRGERSSSKSRKATRRRRRESSARSRSDRKRRDKKSLSPESRREAKKAELKIIKEEIHSSGDKSPVATVPEPAHPPQASREEGRRAPRSPSRPPPARTEWVGPIRAYRRGDHHHSGGDRYPTDRREEQRFPKSKGVKRREKNRAFREANYGRGHYHSHGYSGR